MATRSERKVHAATLVQTGPRPGSPALRDAIAPTPTLLWPARMNRRSVCAWSWRTAAGLFAAAGLLAAVTSPALAQDAWPTQPLKIIVPYAPGGTTDLIARRLGDHLGRELGQTVLIENKPGAATNIGASAVVQAKPDGHTILFGGVGQVLNPAFGPNPGFELMSSLEPVSLVARMPFVLAANPKAVFNNARELMAAAKAKPGALSVSSAQVDVFVELLNTKADIKLLPVPYKGGGPATTDAISGQVDMVYALVPVLLPHLKAGKLKAIAVTSAKRSASLPDVASFAEAGVDYDVTVWYALFVPAGTPKMTVERLARATQRVLGSVELAQSIRSDGAEPAALARPDEVAAMVRSELAFWQGVAKALPHLVQK